MEYLYVAQGVGGLLKVGRSKDTSKRAQQLRREFIAKDDRLQRMEFCEPVESAVGCEFGLIRRSAELLERHSGREWFIGGDFDVIFGIARQVSDETRKREAYENSPAGKRLAARRNAEWSAWQVEFKKQHARCDEARAEYLREKEIRQLAKRRRVLGPMDLIVAHLTAQS